MTSFRVRLAPESWSKSTTFVTENKFFPFSEMGPRYPKWLVFFKIRISRFANASSHRSWHNESAEKMFEKTRTEILLLRCVLFPLLKWQRKIVDIRKNCQSKNYLGGTNKKKCFKSERVKKLQESWIEWCLKN